MNSNHEHIEHGCNVTIRKKKHLFYRKSDKSNPVCHDNGNFTNHIKFAKRSRNWSTYQKRGKFLKLREQGGQKYSRTTSPRKIHSRDFSWLKIKQFCKKQYRTQTIRCWPKKAIGYKIIWFLNYYCWRYSRITIMGPKEKTEERQKRKVQYQLRGWSRNGYAKNTRSKRTCAKSSSQIMASWYWRSHSLIPRSKEANCDNETLTEVIYF